MKKINNKAKENKELNWKEYLEGKTILKSYPPKLGIDLHGECNFKPACVYCDFDYAKKFEGLNAKAPFNNQTLKNFGPFFDNVSGLINCSLGEPLLSKDLPEVLNTFEKKGKWLGMSTNGLLLTRKNRGTLLGKNITLYISLDAATKETFAKIRNDNFEKIINNIRQLSKEKKKFNNLPHIRLVFMPMKLNIHELEDFVKLCADLEVDMMVLRPLNAFAPEKDNPKRGGHKFIYEKELFSFNKMAEISEQAEKYAKKHSVILANQVRFGSEKINASQKKKKKIFKKPICEEPWTNFYILRRGIMPCCYGYAPLAEMSNFEKIWNGLRLQTMRRNLAKGKLSSYCLKSKSCPVTQKYSSEKKISSLKRIEVKLFDKLIYIARKWGLHRLKRFFFPFIK